MVADSRHVNPAYRAASVHPPNLPVYASAAMLIVNPQIIPVFNRPRLVDNPERVKYCLQLLDLKR